jgi:O-antigen ligase
VRREAGIAGRRHDGETLARYGVAVDRTDLKLTGLGVLVAVPLLILLIDRPRVAALCVCGVALLIALITYKLVGLAFLGAVFVPATLAYGLPVQTVTIAYFAFIVLGLLWLAGAPAALSTTTWLVAFAPAVAVLILTVLDRAQAGTVVSATRPAIAVGLLSLGIRTLVKTRPTVVTRAVLPVLWVAAAVGLLAVYQRATGTWPFLDTNAAGPQYTAATYPGRSGGTMGHPIILGLVMTAAIGLTLHIRPRGRWLILTLCTVGLILSGSRSAYVALLVVGIAVVITNRRTLLTARRLIPVLYFSIIAALLAFALARAELSNALGDLFKRFVVQGDASVGQRQDRYRIAWSIITETPRDMFFGHGAGYDTRYLTTTDTGFSTSLTFDNTYLSLWINYGIFGLAVVVVAGLVALRAASLPGRILIGIIGIEALFFEITSWPAVLMLLALGFGLARGSDIRLKREPSEEALTRPRNRARRGHAAREAHSLR